MHDLHDPNTFRAHSDKKVRLRPTQADASLWDGCADRALLPLFKPGVRMFFGLGLPNITIEGLSDDEHLALRDEVFRDPLNLSVAAQWLIMLVVDHVSDPEARDGDDVVDIGMLRFVASGRSRLRSELPQLEVMTCQTAVDDGKRLASIAVEAVRRCLVTHEVFVWYASQGATFDLREFSTSRVRDKCCTYLNGSKLFKRMSETVFTYVGEEHKFFVMSDRLGAAADGLQALETFLQTINVYKTERSMPRPLTRKAEIVRLRGMEAGEIAGVSLDSVRLIDASFLHLGGGVRDALLELFERAQSKSVHAVILAGVPNLDLALVKSASNALRSSCVAVTVWPDFFRGMPGPVPHVLPSSPLCSLAEAPPWITTKSDLRALHWRFTEADPFLTDRFWLQCS